MEWLQVQTIKSEQKYCLLLDWFFRFLLIGDFKNWPVSARYILILNLICLRLKRFLTFINFVSDLIVKRPCLFLQILHFFFMSYWVTLLGWVLYGTFSNGLAFYGDTFEVQGIVWLEWRSVSVVQGMQLCDLIFLWGIHLLLFVLMLCKNRFYSIDLIFKLLEI